MCEVLSRSGRSRPVVVVAEVLLDVLPPPPQRRALARLGQRDAVGERRVGDLHGAVEREPVHVGGGVDRATPAVLGPGLGERRVDLVGRARAVGDPARRDGVRRARAHQRDAVLAQRLLDLEVALVAVGAVVGGDVHPGGADLPRSEHDLAHRVAAHHGEACPPLPQGRVQRAQGGGEVGPAGRPGRAPQRRVQHEQRQHTGRGAGVEQGGVVAEAQVAPEPHHGAVLAAVGCGRGGGHRLHNASHGDACVRMDK